MNCKAVIVGGHKINSHFIAGVTFVRVRQLAEACGGIVFWDGAAKQALVRPALALDWTTLAPLVVASRRWPAHRKMSQWKLDVLWATALRAPVPVDPLLMASILPQEGTGSFNTSAERPAADGGNGPEDDWLLDVTRAVGHVSAKLRVYRTAVAAGFTDQAETLGLQGTAIQFVNWPGPLPDHSPTWGPYAQHADWWRGVAAYYQEMGGRPELLDEWAMRLPLLPLRLRCQAVTNRADLCSDETGTQPRPGVVTWSG